MCQGKRAVSLQRAIASTTWGGAVVPRLAGRSGLANTRAECTRCQRNAKRCTPQPSSARIAAGSRAGPNEQKHGPRHAWHVCLRRKTTSPTRRPWHATWLATRMAYSTCWRQRVRRAWGARHTTRTQRRRIGMRGGRNKRHALHVRRSWHARRVFNAERALYSWHA